VNCTGLKRYWDVSFRVFQHKRPLHTRLVVAETAVEADEGPHGQRLADERGSAMASASASASRACCNAGSHTPSLIWAKASIIRTTTNTGGALDASSIASVRTSKPVCSPRYA